MGILGANAEKSLALRLFDDNTNVTTPYAVRIYEDAADIDMTCPFRDMIEIAERIRGAAVCCRRDQ